MDTKLIIDRGNTCIKLAVFEGARLVMRRSVLGMSEVKDLRDILNEKELSAKGCIFCSVGKQSDCFISSLKRYFGKDFFILNPNTTLPITTKYDRSTLGGDRIAAVVGAWALFPNKDVLVIDAGTAITYERLNSNGEYLGGNISPGMELRFKALNEHTCLLPHVSSRGNLPEWGLNTDEAIRSGVILGLVSEIEGYIRRCRKESADLVVLTTGGQTKYFESRLKNQTFVEDLVLQGLNYILDYQYKNV